MSSIAESQAKGPENSPLTKSSAQQNSHGVKRKARNTHKKATDATNAQIDGSDEKVTPLECGRAHRHQLVLTQAVENFKAIIASRNAFPRDNELTEFVQDAWWDAYDGTVLGRTLPRATTCSGRLSNGPRDARKRSLR